MENSGVLITGGGGFLGSHLAEKFLAQGSTVVCVDNFCTGFKSNRIYLEEASKNNPQKLRFIEADVSLPWQSWSKELDDLKISKVFHFASPASPYYYQQLGLETMWVNSVGLANALAFADSKNAKLVFASTSEIYGDPEISPQVETYWGNVNTLGPRSCYDEAKRFGESLVFTHNLKHGTKHGMVRIFNTYGPRMNPNDGRVIINFLVQAIRGQTLTVYGDGSQTRSFCFVSDLIEGIIRYSSKTNLVDPINIGNENEFSILELAQSVQNLFPEKNLKIKFLDLPKDDPKQRKPSIQRAKLQLDFWSPGIDLQSGLKVMIDWLLKIDLTKIEIPGKPK